MSTMIDGSRKTFQANGAVAKNLLVKVTAGTARDVEVAGATDELAIIGSSEYAAADNAQVEILLCNAPGTRKLTASALIAVNDYIVCAANGKVAGDAAGQYEPVIGIALEAAAADGDIIECLLFPSVRVIDCR